VLATLAVILWLMGCTPCFSFLFHRQGVMSQTKPLAQAGRFILVAGVTAGRAHCLVLPLSRQACSATEARRFLGTVYAKGWPDRVDPVKYPPVKNPNQGHQSSRGMPCCIRRRRIVRSDRKEAAQTQAEPAAPRGNS